ncbi:MAG: glycosyltransferase family 4 protein [Candidatus Woykebacteria bacterium]
MKRKKLFIVVNVDWFFLSHRLPIALGAQKQGFEVTVLTQDTGRVKEIESYGIKVVNIPFERSGTNIFKELNVIKKLIKTFKNDKPDIIHNVAMKASIYGSIAAKFSKSGNVINAISGLGFIFSDGKRGFLKLILQNLMKFSFKQPNVSFIFQNPEDFELFKSYSFASDKNSITIKGSGIDLDEFRYNQPMVNGKIVISLAARMLKDKGIQEFKEASEILKDEYFEKVSWLLIGPTDQDNPSNISRSKLENMNEPGYFEWIGYQDNIADHYKKSDIVMLPSYREGLPKSLIEACAIGRPIITTTAPGCNECVDEGYNGFKVPIKDSKSLAEKSRTLIENKEMRLEFGKNSRIKAEKEFSIENVVEKTLGLYRELLGGGEPQGTPKASSGLEKTPAQRAQRRDV